MADIPTILSMSSCWKWLKLFDFLLQFPGHSCDSKLVEIVHQQPIQAVRIGPDQGLIKTTKQFVKNKCVLTVLEEVLGYNYECIIKKLFYQTVCVPPSPLG